VVPQVNPGPHGEHRRRPGGEGKEDPGSGGDPDALVAEEGEIRGEEEHVLWVAGGPSLGVAGLEGGAGIGPGLVHWGLDELVEDLGDDEAEGEAEALELAAEEEVGDEATEGDEDGDEGHPREEVAKGVAAPVPDVG